MCAKFIYLVMICISDEIKQSGIFLLCRLVSNKFKILYTAKKYGMQCLSQIPVEVHVWARCLLTR